MTLFVKICGLRTEQDVDTAVEAGADAIGFVFSDSPRRIDPATAARLAARVPESVVTVGCSAANPWSTYGPWPRSRASAPSSCTAPRTATTTPHSHPAAWTLIRAAAFGDSVPRCGELGEDMLLLDAPVPGSGIAWDWSRKQVAGAGEKWLLAGGLTPENVREAVDVTRPWGVDVSSGVEASRGVKDPTLITAFVEAARAGAASVWGVGAPGQRRPFFGARGLRDRHDGAATVDGRCGSLCGDERQRVPGDRGVAGAVRRGRAQRDARGALELVGAQGDPGVLAAGVLGDRLLHDRAVTDVDAVRRRRGVGPVVGQVHHDLRPAAELPVRRPGAGDDRVGVARHPGVGEPEVPAEARAQLMEVDLRGIDGRAVLLRRAEGELQRSPAGPVLLPRTGVGGTDPELHRVRHVVHDQRVRREGGRAGRRVGCGDRRLGGRPGTSAPRCHRWSCSPSSSPAGATST